MAYWLVKSEPHVYAWADLVKEGQTLWTGVRNHAAKANMAAMRVGDEVLFYHSNEGKACVGVAKVVKEAVPDPTTGADALTKDGRNPWVAVMLAPVRPLKRPVTLAMVKETPKLKEMALVRLQRLSVQPVTVGEWGVVMGLGGGG